MSRALISRSPYLARLQNEGYAIEVRITSSEIAKLTSFFLAVLHHVNLIGIISRNCKIIVLMPLWMGCMCRNFSNNMCGQFMQQTLFHRHRFSQITRLVHIGTACQRGMVSQQLQRHHVQDRREHTIVLGHADHMQAFA